MPEKINFTKSSLLALEPVPGKRRRVYDEKQKGLAVYISPTGAKAFYCIRKVDGKTEEIRIGDAAAVTIETARTTAAGIINQIAAGTNPAEQRRIKKAEMAFSDLFSEWVKDCRAKGKKSLSKDQDNYRLHLQGLARKKLSDIQRNEVRKLHSTLSVKSGTFLANRVLALVRAMFNFGIKTLDIPGPSNPAAGLKMNREEIHLERKTWTIPGSKAKAKDNITVPLTDAAIDVLQARAETTGTQGWVFPGSGATGHLVEPKKGWQRLLQRAGIDDLRIHDLRRSLASFQIDAGVSLAVIGKGLGHHSQQTTAVYARLAQDPVADALPMRKLLSHRKSAIL